MSSKQLIVFDFDWSMVNQDTDRWVFEVLAIDLRRRIEVLQHSTQWTDLIAESLELAHARGITREQLETALQNIPFHPAMLRAVTTLKADERFNFLCLSNSNQVFISTILQHKNLTHLFQEIITNRAEWDDSGLLKLQRKIDPSDPQHQCTVGCSANMCKGDEIDAFLARNAVDYDSVIYVGDGNNDYCAIKRLRSQDMVLCRTGMGLQRRIETEGGLKCKVKYWMEAWEIEETFNTL